jgi:alkaline phosphatase D
MKNKLIMLVLVAGFSCKQSTSRQESITMPDADGVTIAFGSCAHSYEPMPIFKAIVANKPDVWVWLGDIMYGDSHDMSVLKEKYDRQKTKPVYRKLMLSAEIIGIWDDHDYGVNDGGKYYSEKDKSKELLLDFLDVAENDPVRAHKGVYSEHDFSFGDKLVKVVLLDTRYFRDTLDADTGGMNRYQANEEGDILGEEQWQWFEDVLRKSKADFHIIGSGIQVIAEEQGFEKWANFPKSRQRMFALLADINPKPLLFISGDRHIAEVSKIDLPGLDYPLYDFTASGLTHTWGMYRPEVNKYRVDSLIVSKNFGLIKIHWQARPKITLEIRGEDDELIQRTEINY